MVLKYEKIINLELYMFCFTYNNLYFVFSHKLQTACDTTSIHPPWNHTLNILNKDIWPNILYIYILFIWYNNSLWYKLLYNTRSAHVTGLVLPLIRPKYLHVINGKFPTWPHTEIFIAVRPLRPEAFLLISSSSVLHLLYTAAVKHISQAASSPDSRLKLHHLNSL